MSKSQTGLDRSGAQRLRHAKKYPVSCPRCGNMTLLKDAMYAYNGCGEVTIIGCSPCMKEFFAEAHREHEEQAQEGAF